MVSTNEAIQMAESAELDLVCTFLSTFFCSVFGSSNLLILVAHNCAREFMGNA